MKRSEDGSETGCEGVAVLVLATVVLAANIARAQPAAFTYQGRLNDGASPASGIYQMRFTLHGADTGQAVVAGPITHSSVEVSDGLFTTTLEFGQEPFNGNRRWLEIAVATNGASEFTVLSPRQEIRPAPYAMRAASVDGMISSNALAGSYSRPVSLVNPANVFAGDGGGLTNVEATTLEGFTPGDFWRIGGNSGNHSNSFLGTTDGEPLELRVNNKAGLRLEASLRGGVNMVGGNGTAIVGAAEGATIAGGVSNMVQCLFDLMIEGATIGGGLQNILANTPYATISGGAGNSVYESHYASISGGNSNLIGGGPFEFYRADFGLIGGGFANQIRDGAGSVIAGGAENQIEQFTEYSSVLGGQRNRIGATSRASTIGGGQVNQITAERFTDGGVTIAGGAYNEARGEKVTISGGEANQISGKRWGTISGGIGNRTGAQASTIGGGSENYIFGDDLFASQSPNATIGGGSGNRVLHGAGHATIAGGQQNTIAGSNMSDFGTRGGAIGGGMGNLILGAFGTIPGGIQALAQNYGQMAYASGSFGAPGDAQTGTYICRGVTSDETPADLFLDGLSQRIAMPTNSTWTFEILVSGRAQTGYSACYRIWGAAKNDEGVTTMFGKVKQKNIAEDDETWSATASASGTDNTWAVQVIGARDIAIRWVATVRTSEVSY